MSHFIYKVLIFMDSQMHIPCILLRFYYFLLNCIEQHFGADYSATFDTYKRYKTFFGGDHFL